MRIPYVVVMTSAALLVTAACAAPDPLDNLDESSPQAAPSAPETESPAQRELPTAELTWAYPLNDPPMPREGDAREVLGDEEVRLAVNWAFSVDAATAYDIALWDYMVTNNVSWEELDGVQLAPWFEFFTDSGSSKFEKQLNSLADPDTGIGDFVIVPEIADNFEWPAPSLRPSGVVDPNGETIPGDEYRVFSADVGPESDLAPGEKTIVVTFQGAHRYDYLRDGEWTALTVIRNWTMTLAPTDDPRYPFLIQDWTLGETELFDADPVPRDVAPKAGANS
jgi:hypothetical protein